MESLIETAQHGSDPSSPAVAPSRPVAVVCVPTYRRPAMLAATLASLQAQVTTIDFAVVVVDNDAQAQEGLAVARSFLTDGRLAGCCLVEERQGNCYAINRAFTTAREKYPAADYLLMIDDDEIAAPNWLDAMVAAAIREGADVVGGPVLPQFPADVDGSLRRHPVYWPAFSASGKVPMIYGSGNCLIRREIFSGLTTAGFDLAFNFLGGGDTEFFTRCRRAGRQFYWVQEAVIVETVTPNRLDRKWVLQRGLRIGAINYKIDRSNARTVMSCAKLVGKNLAIVPLSFYRAARLALSGEPALTIVHPMVVALGRLFAACEIYPLAYRAPAKVAAAQ